VGQLKVSFTVTQYWDTIKITFINPEINPDSRLLLIRMEVPNTNLSLKPGMQAVAQLTQSNLKGLFIPIDAVIRDENTYIWVEKSHGVYENDGRNRCRIDGTIEIKTALDPTKKVVITGAYAISEYKFEKGMILWQG
jgi:Cu(I)/Ag(I) efflux system membrane fusion protein